MQMAGTYLTPDINLAPSLTRRWHFAVQPPAYTLDAHVEPHTEHNMRATIRSLSLSWLLFAALLSGVSVAQDAGKSGAQADSTKPATKPDATSAAPLPLPVFWALLFADEPAAQASLQRIRAGWSNAYAPLLIELFGEMRHPKIRSQVAQLLNRASGLGAGGVQINVAGWYEWLWSIDPGVHPDYAEFKASYYELIDARFREYFAGRPNTEIRLDEIRWGGVSRDGIPPLKNPKMIAAREAAYLGDGDIVFGVAIDGDVRAYPKRILAWHEMVKDRIAGRDLNGVYCTLCGSMILYDPMVNGVHHELGTSGFLYRSNKLMYDHATKSMWSTLTGTPVVGALTGRGIELKPLYVVTTTWKEWKRRHPNTLVLSLDTGHRRDYSEGAAYRDYFSTDRLMFNVPKLDTRLANKAEVLALRFDGARGEALAVAAAFLQSRPVYHDRIGTQAFVVLTDTGGANRVYETRGIEFAAWNRNDEAKDTQGRGWKVLEDRLAGPGGQSLARLPAHRAFWFGWYSAYPGTRLVR